MSSNPTESPAVPAGDGGSRGPWIWYLLLAIAVAIRLRGTGFNISLDGGWVGAWHADEYGLWNKSGLIWPDLDPHYWGYPALHLYLLAALNGLAFALARVLGMAPDLDYHAFLDAVPGLRYLLGRWLSVAAGVGTIVLLARRGRVAARGAAPWAAAFLALCPLHVHHSHYATLGALFALLFTAAALAQVDLAHGKRRNAVVAGLLAGLAVSEKYNAVVLLVTLPVAAALGARRGGGSVVRGIAKSAAAAFAITLAINFAFPLNFETSWAELTHNVDRVVRLDTGAAEVHPIVDYLKMLARHTGIGLLLMSIVGIAAFSRRQRAAGTLLALILVGYLALMASFGFQVPRYTLPIVPLVCLLAAAGCAAIGSTTGRWARFSTPVLGLVVLAEMLPRTRAVVDIFATTDSRIEASRWIRRNLPENSSIAVESQGEYGPTVNAELFDLTPFSFFVGQPMYGPFVKQARWLLIGHDNDATPNRKGGVALERIAVELHAPGAREAERLAPKKAAEIGLERWTLENDVPCGDFASLLAKGIDYVAITESMYGNPETGAFSNFYRDLWSDPRTTRVALFPGRDYDHSVHHPEIRIYHVGAPDLRSGTDRDGYYRPDKGHAYLMDIPSSLVSDIPGAENRSHLALFEDGVPLGPAHQRHELIRSSGGGRYSHLNKRLVFSTSDGSDPNTNGRRYHWIELR